MKAINVAIYALVLWMISSTANAQDYSIQTRPVEGKFSKVKASGDVEVQIVKGDDNKMELNGLTKIVNKIETKVEDGTLVIYLKPGAIRYDVKVILYCNCDVEALEVEGGSEIKARKIAGTDLTIKASGGSEIDIHSIEITGKMTIDAQSGAEIDIDNLTANELYVKATSGADVDLKGYVKRAELNATAGAEIDVEDMRFDNINASATAGGMISR